MSNPLSKIHNRAIRIVMSCNHKSQIPAAINFVKLTKRALKRMVGTENEEQLKWLFEQLDSALWMISEAFNPQQPTDGNHRGTSSDSLHLSDSNTTYSIPTVLAQSWAPAMNP